MNKQINKFPWKRFPEKEARWIGGGGGGEVSVIKLTGERPSGLSNDLERVLCARDGQRRKQS